jgi:hypothetical protein
VGADLLGAELVGGAELADEAGLAGLGACGLK